MSAKLVYTLFYISLLFYGCNCEWISFVDYFASFNSLKSANVIRTKANCEANTIQIIPGDCRPVY